VEILRWGHRKWDVNFGSTGGLVLPSNFRCPSNFVTKDDCSLEKSRADADNLSDDICGIS